MAKAKELGIKNLSTGSIKEKGESGTGAGRGKPTVGKKKDPNAVKRTQDLSHIRAKKRCETQIQSSRPSFPLEHHSPPGEKSAGEKTCL